MSDIFISYASEDRERAKALAAALESQSWSVWWDRTLLPGKEFDVVIEHELDASCCVIVLWSETSVASRWVRAEAREGLDRNKLIPIFLGEVKVPLVFRGTQGADLADWSGEIDSPAFRQLVDAVADMIGSPPTTEAKHKAGEEHRQLTEEKAKRKTAKNIVICCDGTGNEFGIKGGNSNVVRVFLFLRKSDPSEQVVFYEPGIGTQPRATIHMGLLAAFVAGYGLTRNIERAYRFLMENYEWGDRVYLFGFSAGAYTVRALAGMLRMCGLLQKGAENLIPYTTKLYQGAKPDFKAADKFREAFCRECKLHYVGIWDTVKTVGWFPIGRKALPYMAENEDIRYGRHAVSIDEQRRFCRQNLWTYSKANQGREGELEQLWFAGVHSDVGGGYEETGLSDIALEWVLKGATERVLRALPNWDQALQKNPTMPAHNGLWPFFWVMGGGPRQASGKPPLHPSAEQRIEQGLTRFPARLAPSTYIGNIMFWLFWLCLTASLLAALVSGAYFAFLGLDII